MTEDTRGKATAHALPLRVARGSGRMPTHVHYIFHGQDGRYRIEMHDAGSLRSALGFYRSIACADDAAYDRQMEAFIAARIPFMIGYVIGGPSDDAWFWLKARGRPIRYLEISCGGASPWSVQEVAEGGEATLEVPLADLLGTAQDRVAGGRSAAILARIAKMASVFCAQIAYLLPVVAMCGAFALAADGLFDIQFLDEFSDLAVRALLWCVPGGLIYGALWPLLMPQTFARWRERLLLLAYGITFGFPVALVAIGYINVYRDDAPTATFPSVVLEQVIFKGRNRNPDGWNHQLVVRSWRPQRAEERVSVGRAVYGRLAAGAAVEIRLHPGRLGMPWYTRDEAAAPAFVGLLPEAQMR
jgi:hypothetical protein